MLRLLKMPTQKNFGLLGRKQLSWYCFEQTGFEKRI